MNRWLQRALQALPLIGAASLLGRLTAITETPLSGVFVLPWRLDALTLVFLLGLTLGIAVVPLGSRRSAIGVIAVTVLLPALLLEHVLALPLALLIVGILVQNRRWLLAAGGLLIALGWLYLTGGSSWNAPQIAAALTPPIFLLLLAGCCAGLNVYPVALLHEHPDPLRLALQPIWLLPLLRTLAWGPWNTGWALALVVLGSATALWAGGSALWIAGVAQRTERVAGAWLGSALASLGLVSTVGVAGALWQLLAFALGIGLLLRADRLRVWAAPVPITAGFVAGWLTLGAAAAGGAWLFAAVLWLATLLSGIAIFTLPAATADHPAETIDGGDPPLPSPPARASWLLTGATLLLGVLAPLPLRLLIVPAIDLVQGGLTPFGLLDIWPWVGLAALDAGQRRVAVLPSIAVFVQALVVAALVWLVARLLSHGEAEQPPHAAERWRALKPRVWWARGTRRRG